MNCGDFSPQKPKARLETDQERLEGATSRTGRPRLEASSMKRRLPGESIRCERSQTFTRVDVRSGKIVFLGPKPDLPPFLLQYRHKVRYRNEFFLRKGPKPRPVRHLF